ncbi:MAG: hypothetical protein K6E86_08295 [Bacteroidales bacterium]|nr:hypothetical protein [Bacteroidales bacterium]
MERFTIDNRSNASSIAVRQSLRYYTTVAIIAIVAMMCVSSMCRAQSLTVRTPAFAQPLVEQWAALYNASHAADEQVAVAGRNQEADIQITVSRHQAEQLGQTTTVFGRYAILPFVTAGSEAARTFGNKHLSKSRLEHIYFALDDEDDEFGDYADAAKGMSVYSGNSQASVANSFAEFFGQEAAAFRGKRIQGDDRFVNVAVSRDAKALSFNALSNLYDLTSRNLRDNIQLLGLDVSRRLQSALEDNDLDAVLNALEQEQDDDVAIANISLSYDATNPQTVAFISWVLTEGVKYNHQFGLLNAPEALQAVK